MKTITMWAGLMLGVSVASMAVAADAKPKKEYSEKQLAQQQRMKDCSAEAKTKEMKGSDRKAFMKTCLSGGTVTAAPSTETASAPAAPASQKDKMKTCNADAKTQALTGDARKQFMSSCLSK